MIRYMTRHSGSSNNETQACATFTDRYARPRIEAYRNTYTSTLMLAELKNMNCVDRAPLMNDVDTNQQLVNIVEVLMKPKKTW